MPVLEHERVVAGGAEPVRFLYVLHGIYGAGRNWGSVARRLVRERPDWGAMLVDLRQHGGSQGFAAPHTVEAAAADLAGLAAHTGTAADAVLGHSFGGKVALLFAGGAAGAAVLGALRQVWVIDSTPAAREPEGSAWTMLQLIRGMRDRFASRDELIERLAEGGISRPVGQWMATNLVPADGGYRWRFSLDDMDALLTSFFETDAWSVVEHPPPGVEVHLVRAEDSSVLSGATLARAEAAADGRAVHLHSVAGGHWVNAENPDAVVDLLVQMLPRQ